MYGDAQLIDADDGVVGAYVTEPWDVQRLVERCYLCQPAVFFRRRVIEQYGLLDERLQLCLDYEYWLRLANAGAIFAYLPAGLAASRVHADTKTLRARPAVHHEINTMFRERFGRVPESWLVNHAHTLVELDRGGERRRALPYAVDVVARAACLSLEWNHSISTRLVATLLAPLVQGAVRRLSWAREYDGPGD